MTKRIRLTIEWDGACSEMDWAREMSKVINKADRSRVSKVVRTELLTAYGTTEVGTDLDVPPSRSFWDAFFDLVLGPLKGSR